MGYKGDANLESSLEMAHDETKAGAHMIRELGMTTHFAWYKSTDVWSPEDDNGLNFMLQDLSNGDELEKEDGLMTLPIISKKFQWWQLNSQWIKY